MPGRSAPPVAPKPAVVAAVAKPVSQQPNPFPVPQKRSEAPKYVCMCIVEWV